PYAAEVHALPSETSTLTQGAPSMRANASRCPPASMTANDIDGAPSSVRASRAAAHRLMPSSRLNMAVTFLLWPSAVVVKPPWPIGDLTGVLQHPPGRQEHLRHH